MAEYQVRLYRDSLSTPWGFRVQGGADFYTPLIVQRVFTGSPAEGELQRGDIVSSIENFNTDNMMHKDAQDLIKGSGGALTLGIRKHGGPSVGSMHSSQARGRSAGPVQNRGSSGSGMWHQQPPNVPQSRGPEFGVQYGSGRPKSIYHNPPDMMQRTLPVHNRQNTGTSDMMMDKVNQSLASMDLYEASRRAQDDNDIDYSFTQQSVNERKRAFMNSYHQPSATYHSVPRNPISAASANKLRYQKKGFDPVFGARLPEFGWSPSNNSLRRSAAPSSSAGFEQDSYLPSMGHGRPESPRGHFGKRPHMNSSPQHVSRPRYSTSVRMGQPQRTVYTGASSAPVVAAANVNVLPMDSRVQNKQYNTPINMYSNQNVVAAIEGQTGIPVTVNDNYGTYSESPTSPAHLYDYPYSQPHSNSSYNNAADVNQSSVYKLVHEQDQQQQHHHKQASWNRPVVAAAPSTNDYGVSDF